MKKIINSIILYQWHAQASRGAGAKCRYEGTIADRGWGYQDSRFYHDSLSCWFFYFASCLSITAKLIPYYKDKEIKYKQLWHITRPKWVKVKIVVIILSLLLKNENKDTHYKYT